MKKVLCAALLSACTAPAFAGDVGVSISVPGVSISVGQPGFYGQINIGNMPPPQLVYTQPVVIQRAPEYVSAPPIYLHVPSGYERTWRRHCAEYNACGRPVYFVRDDWYKNEYVPRYQHDHHEHDGDHHGRDHDKHDHDDHDHDKHHDRDG